MYLADGWKDYEIIDAGNDEKLERWGKVILLRPDPQAIWPMKSAGYCDAHYIRSSTGGGAWNFNRTLPESWVINYRDLSFIVRPTGFKHTGLFPEQAVNWDFMHNYVDKYVKKTGRPFRVLNLFAYTGGATCALAAAGAEVVHVDAAKGIVAWAKNNLAQSGLADKPVRFIVDDVMKFVLREQRRGVSTKVSSWIRPATAEDPTAKCGALKPTSIRWFANAYLFSVPMRVFSLSTHTRRVLLLR